MKLNRLTIANFKGIKSFTFDPEGKNASIYGDNATCKTTISDAVSWVMTDKDTLGAARFGIKPIDIDGQCPDIEVELEFDEITLKKIYRETWTKKRGQHKATMTGNTTEYFINGVPMIQKEYFRKIEEKYCDPGLFRILSIPRAFNEELKPDQRRKILVEAFGDVSDEEVIASDATGLFERIPILTDKKTVDEARGELEYRKKAVNKKLKDLPARIDEQSRGLSETPVDVSALNKEKSETETKLAILRNELSMIESGGAAGMKKTELQDIKNQIAEIERGLRKKADDEAARLRSVANFCRESYDNAVREIRELKKDKESVCSSLRLVESEINKLVEQWKSIKAQVFVEPESTGPCAACGALPEHQINFSAEKLEADFNRRKADSLGSIIDAGNEKKKLKEEVEKKLSAINKKIEAAEPKMEKLKADLDAAVKARDATPEKPKPTKEHQSLIERQSAIEAELSKISAGSQGETEQINQDIEKLDSALSSINSKLGTVSANEKARIRIEDLKIEEKSLGAEFESIEADLQLLEDFTRAKCRMLSERINSQFEITEFQLWEELINGGMKDICTATVGGVQYPDLNNAARINCGLDAIQALSKHFGVEFPVFVDNSESITQLLPIKNQLIRLVVSEQDKKLRIVLND